MSEGALKYDGGKPRMDLLDAYAIEELAKVLTFGAKKYAPWNWAKGMEFSRLQAAALRHIFSFQAGEDLDPESGLPHLAHAMCCLMFLLSITQRHPEMDDRVPSPNEPRGPLTIEAAPTRVLCSTRELELEKLLKWTLGYDIEDMPDFRPELFAWRGVVLERFQRLGGLLS